MISNQSLAFVENGVAKGISKGHRGLLFRDGQLTVVDGAGVEAAVGPDEDGNLTIGGIVLTDTGAVAKAENSLGINSSGHVILHDGVQDGDDLPNLRPSYRIRVAQNVTQAEARAPGGYYKKLGGFPLPLAKCVVGTRWRVTGSYFESHATTVDAKPVVFGFTFTGAAGVGVGVGPYVNMGNSLLHVSMPSFSFEMELTDAAPGLLLSKVEGYAGSVFYHATVSTAALMRTSASDASTDEYLAEAAATEIGLYVSAAQGVSATTVDFVVDVLIEDITP